MQLQCACGFWRMSAVRDECTTAYDSRGESPVYQRRTLALGIRQ
ncbi:hypothetical protein [Paenibacillus elgii]|nr:hypothetical protein [Paenibacillus elgii]